MKKHKKIISIIMISFIFISTFLGVNINKVKAVNLPIANATLYSKGNVKLFKYDDNDIDVDLVFYKKDGIEYPAYSLNKGRNGVDSSNSYLVNVNKYITNNGVWKAIVNGYPFKTPQELGCLNIEEAYAATKMAVYDALYNYDINKFDVNNSDGSSARTVEAIKKIIMDARNSTNTRINSFININEEIEKWQVDDKDNKYVSKIYSVKSLAPFKEYMIDIQGNNISRFKITDINGITKNKFNSNENFKVMIPIVELEEAGKFTLNVQANLETYPILFGESSNINLQNYAIVVGEYEKTEIKREQKYFKNRTEIAIIKQDGDTNTPLANAIFNLYDINNKLVYQDIITDSKGSANIFNLKPGKYYLKEIKAPDGYYGYEENINLDVRLNEKVVITVDNYIETKHETIEKPQDENHLSAGTKKETEILPPTGI